MFLAGVSVPDRLVLKIAYLVNDDELEMKLRGVLLEEHVGLVRDGLV